MNSPGKYRIGLESIESGESPFAPRQDPVPLTAGTAEAMVEAVGRRAAVDGYPLEMLAPSIGGPDSSSRSWVWWEMMVNNAVSKTMEFAPDPAADRMPYILPTILTSEIDEDPPIVEDDDMNDSNPVANNPISGQPSTWEVREAARQDHDRLANELRTEMRESRTEMTAALNRIVDSVERSRGELLAEISSTRTELVSQIGSVRTDLSAEIREVRDQSARNNAQIQWMLGGIGAIVSLLLLGGAGAAIYAALS